MASNIKFGLQAGQGKGDDSAQAMLYGAVMADTLMHGHYIRRLRKAADLTQERVAELAGISPQAVSQWENNKTSPSFETFMTLAHKLTHPGVVGPRGNISAITDVIDSMARAYGSSGSRPERTVPLISKVAAGRWTAAEDPYPLGEAEEFIPVIDRYGPDCFALWIDGDSMQPEFHSGDLVIIDPLVSPLPGDYVVAKLENDEETTFKKYRLRGTDSDGQPIVDLVALNPDWPTLRLDAEHPGTVIGVMVEHRKFRKRD